jgi:pimeloyl-ACP methyl ester carboxylesterase
MRIWLIRLGVALAALILMSLLGGASFEATSRANASKSYPPPGRLVDIGGRRIQLDCRGSGSPVVVFESGLDTLGSLSWSSVHQQIAQTTRACAYSRTGVMWSDPSNRPFSAEHIAEDLHTTLTVAGEAGPYVVVGHSLGGPYLLVFTHRYPSDVAGLVFVDASHPDQFARLAAVAGRPLDPGTAPAHIGRAINGLGILRLFLPHGTPPPHLSAGAIAQAGAWFPQSLPSEVAELDALEETLTAARMSRALGDRPLIVLTRGEKSPPESAAQLKISQSRIVALDAEWLTLQNDQATWSTSSRHKVVPGASHYIQLDQPDAVIAAVNDVVTQVHRRSSGP